MQSLGASRCAGRRPFQGAQKAAVPTRSRGRLNVVARSPVAGGKSAIFLDEVGMRLRTPIARDGAGQLAKTSANTDILSFFFAVGLYATKAGEFGDI